MGVDENKHLLACVQGDLVLLERRFVSLEKQVVNLKLALDVLKPVAEDFYRRRKECRELDGVLYG